MLIQVNRMGILDQFDAIYCINLPELTQRRALMDQQFKRFGVLEKVKYLPAHNNRSKKVLDAVQNGDTYTLMLHKVSQIAISFSFLEVWEDIAKHKYDMALILEDDVIFKTDCRKTAKFLSRQGLMSAGVDFSRPYAVHLTSVKVAKEKIEYQPQLLETEVLFGNPGFITNHHLCEQLVKHFYPICMPCDKYLFYIKNMCHAFDGVIVPPMISELSCSYDNPSNRKFKRLSERGKYTNYFKEYCPVVELTSCGELVDQLGAYIVAQMMGCQVSWDGDMKGCASLGTQDKSTCGTLKGYTSGNATEGSFGTQDKSKCCALKGYTSGNATEGSFGTQDKSKCCALKGYTMGCPLVGNVFGAGISVGNEDVSRIKYVYSVRGRYTYQYLVRKGIACPEIYGDPVLLLPLYYCLEVEKRYSVGVVSVGENRCMVNGHFIELGDNLFELVDQIRQCEHIVSDQLYGLMIATSYGIPTTWVNLGTNHELEIRDFYSAFGLNIAMGEKIVIESNVLNRMSELVEIACPFNHCQKKLFVELFCRAYYPHHSMDVLEA